MQHPLDIHIHINTDTPAFHKNPEGELIKVNNQVVDCVRNMVHYGYPSPQFLSDSNNVIVGSVKVVDINKNV